jgi:hypothetical protein
MVLIPMPSRLAASVNLGQQMIFPENDLDDF